MKYQVVLIQMSEDCRVFIDEMVVYEGTNKSIARATEYRYNGRSNTTCNGFRYAFAEFRELA